MIDDLLPRPQSQTISQFYDQARMTILVSMAFALLGALFGVVLQFRSGAPFTLEGWLIASCLLFSSVMIGVLLTRPFDQIPWVPPLASVYFLGYLSFGALLAIFDAG